MIVSGASFAVMYYMRSLKFNQCSLVTAMTMDAQFRGKLLDSTRKFN